MVRPGIINDLLMLRSMHHQATMGTGEGEGRAMATEMAISNPLIERLYFKR